MDHPAPAGDAHVFDPRVLRALVVGTLEVLSALSLGLPGGLGHDEVQEDGALEHRVAR